MSAPRYTTHLPLRDQVRVDLASALDGLANDRWRHAQEADQLGHPDWGAVFGRAAEILHELASDLRRAVGT